MRKSKFITLLKTLDNKETKAFSSYLNSMYKTKNLECKIFNYIKRFHPEYNTQKLELLAIKESVFLQTKPSNKQLTNCLSQLYQYLLEFLMLEEYNKNEVRKSLETIRILKSRKLNHLADLKTKGAKKKLSQTKIKDENYYLNHLLINYISFHYDESFQIKKDSTLLQNLQSHLDYFFLIVKLKIIAENKNRSNLLNKEIDINLLPLIEHISEKHLLDKNPLLKIYTLIIRLLEKDSSTATFFELRKLVTHHINHLSKSDTKSILIYLSNFAARRIREGDLSLLKDVFEINKLNSETDALIVNNKIPISRFINFVDVACSLKEFTWAKGFINEKRKYIEHQNRDTTTRVALARMEFEQQDFDSVLNRLAPSKSENIYLELRIRSLQIRSHYELNTDKEFILSYCNAFEQYLRRNQTFNTKIIHAYQNFVKIIRHLTNKKKSKKEILDIKNDFKELICRDWIDKKIGDYQN